MHQERLEIQTGRLLLRELAQADAPRLSEIGGVPEVARMMLRLTSPWPLEAVQAWIEDSQYRGAPGFRLAIEHPEAGVIGAIGLGPQPQPPRLPSLMYFIATAHSGRGYASEAARALLAFAFAKFDLAEIEADHFIDNPASGRILHRLGFIETGSFIGESAGRLEPAPLTLYRLKRTLFEAINS